MITNDKGIVELKHFILREVCRLAWDGRLNADETEKIVYQVSPGPKPQYRCCVYKEREIVRGRIRLAMGQDPEPGHPSTNVVSVISAACSWQKAVRGISPPCWILPRMMPGNTPDRHPAAP